MVRCSEFLCSSKLMGNLVEDHNFTKITYTSPNYIGTGRVNISQGDEVIYVLKDGLVGSGMFDYWEITSKTHILVLDGFKVREDQLIFIGKV